MSHAIGVHHFNSYVPENSFQICLFTHTHAYFHTIAIIIGKYFAFFYLMVLYHISLRLHVVLITFLLGEWNLCLP